MSATAPSPPFRIALRRMPFNRSSIAAVYAVLEQELARELEDGAMEIVLAESIAEALDAGLVCYSFTSPQREAIGEELARLAPRHSVAGGPHASAAPDDTLALGFDWVARGEAGPRFAAFVRSLADGQPPPRGWLPSDPPLPLDTYDPWPKSGALFCQIEITRGCPYVCSFCQVPVQLGRKPRHRSLPLLRRLFDQAVATGHTFTRFVAPNAFGYGVVDPRKPDAQAIEGLLRAARDAGMQKVFFGCFPSEVRPESVRDDLLQLVRDYCTNDSLVIGLQSGSDEELRRIQRGHDVATGVAAIERIARAGLTPIVDFIFGLPGQTDADRAQSRELIARLREDCNATINVHLFDPLPGTPLADAPPSPIDRVTHELIDSLVGKGHAYAPRVPRLLEVEE